MIDGRLYRKVLIAEGFGMRDRDDIEGVPGHRVTIVAGEGQETEAPPEGD